MSQKLNIASFPPPATLMYHKNDAIDFSEKLQANIIDGPTSNASNAFINHLDTKTPMIIKYPHENIIFPFFSVHFE